MSDRLFVKKTKGEYGVFVRLVDAWFTDWSKVWVHLRGWDKEGNEEVTRGDPRAYPKENRVYVQMPDNSYRHSFATKTEAENALQWHAARIVATRRSYHP